MYLLYLRDVHEAGAAALEAEEGAVAHDVLHLGGDELARVLTKSKQGRRSEQRAPNRAKQTNMAIII